MTPIQQLMLGVGAKKKTYLNDVFSTYLTRGTGSTKTINNGINLSGEGGLVWQKCRSIGQEHLFIDSERGLTKVIKSNSNSSEFTASNSITSFNANGFTQGAYGDSNQVNIDYSTLSFRKAPGFFDVVTYTGSGSTQQIAHNLGSIPGCYMIKCTSHSGSWMVYHRQLNNGVNAAHYRLMLDGTSNEQDDNVFGDTAPTATHFTAGSSHAETNQSGRSYVCYLFAGGESSQNEAASVDFDGNGDYLVVYNQADLSPEDGDFTCEMWIKPDSWSTGDSLVYASSSGFSITRDGSNNALKVGMAGSTTHLTSTSLPEVGQWTHVAVARSGTTMRLFFNGVLNKTETVSHNYASPVTMYIVGGGGEFNGKISNFRFVKGTAVYTSSFRPPTEPLANITNTKLLCCNGSSTNSSTVTPGTLNAEGNPTASSDSPFDDPSGFVFGDAGDQNVIKCGSYTGNGSDTVDIDVNLGWEPQWLMWKCTDLAEPWYMSDSMRGIISAGNDNTLLPNSNQAENVANWDLLDLTSTGFKLKTSDDKINGDGHTYAYIAIRRPDPLVQKPQLATDVFAMDTGNGSSTIPAFDSGFPVDFAIKRSPASSDDWKVTTRLTGLNVVKTNSTAAESSSTTFVYDSNVGWAKNQNSNDQGWMWKRHAGFDVVTYKGDGVAGRQIPHSMNKTPEMIWIRARNGGEWIVGHHGVNGGTNPWNYEMLLHDTRGEGASANKFNNTAPNSRVFTVGDNTYVNASGTNYVSMLFSSVSGISSVGSYTGNGSTTGPIITTGFQPRLIMLKRADDSGSWYLYDTLRGITSGNDHRIELNDSSGQSSGADDVDVLSTGFQLKHTWDNLNGSGGKYLYFCHA